MTCGRRTWMSVWLLLVVLVSHHRGVLSQCTQDGYCKCTSSEGTIDLNPIQGSSSQAAFPDVPDQTSGYWEYSYSPCTPFSEGVKECVNVAVCQVANDQSDSYPAGTVDSAQWGSDGNGNTMITYSQTDSQGTTRTTYVTLICDQSGGQDKLDVQGEVAASTYGMTLTSVHCCPSGDNPNPPPSGGGGGGGLSVGSVLCIVLVVVVFVYIAAGVAIQKGVRKASGKEIIPNYSLWTSLPGLIKDGTMFVVTRGRTGNYAKI